MTEPKTPTRHPSTEIPDEIVRELCYRTYLRRLEPPMTPEQSLATTRHDAAGKVIADDATRRKNAAALAPLMRDVLRVEWDMGLISESARSRGDEERPNG